MSVEDSKVRAALLRMAAGQRQQRSAVVVLSPQPEVFVFGPGGELRGGRACANIQDAARTVIRAKHDDDVNEAYDGTREVYADLSPAEYRAAAWAAGKSKTKMDALFRRAVLAEVSRIARERTANGGNVPQHIWEVLATDGHR